MRKSWSLALAVIAVGIIAGAAIAGRPVPSDPFVLDPSITVPTALISTTEVGASTSTTRPSQTTTATTIAEATTTSTPRSTTGTATSTSVSAAVASTISTTTTSTTTTTTTAAKAGPLPRDQVRLVIANGDGRFRLASITADRIRPLGYPIDLGDTLQKVPATIVYYRPGFDDEAAIVAQDILVPNAIIKAYPSNASQPVTNSDLAGDVIVVLGPDAPR